MALQFPNISRSFDVTRGCVRFSGYDHTREVAFFIKQNVVYYFNRGALVSLESFLAAFDHHRDRICHAAVRAYG